MTTTVLRTGLLSLAVSAGWGPAVADARVAGPHQGRIIEAAGARLEFVLDKERKAHLYVLDAAGVPVAPGRITVTLRANLKSGGKAVPVTATTSGIDGSKETVRHFASKAAVPSPGGYELVVTVTSTGKTGNVRFRLVEHLCGGCGLVEYACICGH